MSLWKVFLQPIEIRRPRLTSGGYFRVEDFSGYLKQEDGNRLILENSTFGPLLAVQSQASLPVTQGFQAF
jgi:hypothetical protein